MNVKRVYTPKATYISLGKNRKINRDLDEKEGVVPKHPLNACYPLLTNYNQNRN